MAIRITGMYSGLDTESIINELASAQSYKKTKLVKAQIKHSWKQDAWKALNTKIYSFYQKLDDLRLAGSYKKKKTTVSNPDAVKVVSSSDTMNGVHTLSVEKLAKQAYLTGAKLEKADGTDITASTTLKQLGFSGSGSISVNGANGKETKIDVSEDMTINKLINQIKATGLNASFDQDNQRIFISSQNTGKDENFFLTANDQNGFTALGVLGLLTAPPAADTEEAENSAEYQEYKKWKAYGTDADAKAKLIEDMTASRAAKLKNQNEALEKQNAELTKKNDENKSKLADLEGYADYGNLATFKTLDGKGVSTYAEMQTALYDRIYGAEVEVDKTDDEGNVVTDGEGNAVKVKERQGGMTQNLEQMRKQLKDLESAETRDESAIAAKKADIEAVQKEISKAKEVYGSVSTIATNEKTIQKNQDTIDANAQKFSVDASDPDNIKVEGTDALKAEVAAEVDTKIAAATDFLDNISKYTGGKTAHKIQGRDAEFILDGVEYTSKNNNLSVNGMTITAMEQNPGKEITLTTTDDTDGVYDMIKDLFKSYNELINEMDSLYNASSAKGYEPLTSEEKDALSDSEIEEWEQKVKDSLLRRDSTLSSVTSAMKMVMMTGVNVKGKTMYLSDFGIETLSYDKAKDNERGAYHIAGDPDDPDSKSSDDVLRAMIAKDPDTVTDFFVGLTRNMHDELAKKMSGTKFSSALTVYNDKKMKEEYDDYTKKIKEQEEKLNAYIDKWYAKFSSMETALSKLESKNNSLSSLFGG